MPIELAPRTAAPLLVVLVLELVDLDVLDDPLVVVVACDPVELPDPVEEAPELDPEPVLEPEVVTPVAAAA